jgi:hypothetical protein
MVHKYSIPLSTEGIVLYTMYDEPLYTISLVSSLGGDPNIGGGITQFGNMGFRGCPRHQCRRHMDIRIYPYIYDCIFVKV